MVLTRTAIELKEGVRVELLVTPALYGEAREHGVDLDLRGVKDGSMESLYRQIGIIYFSALVAWKANRYDDPSLGDFPYKFVDFVSWATTYPEAFKEAVSFAGQAFMVLTENEKKKTKPQVRKGWLRRLITRR